jgi:hypothetical protein
MKYRNHPIWHQAMIRGLEEGLRVDRLRFPPEYVNDGFDVYLVETSRKDGSRYLVQLHRSEHNTWVVCSCRAGQNRNACKHAALILYYVGIMQPGSLAGRKSSTVHSTSPVAA